MKRRKIRLKCGLIHISGRFLSDYTSEIKRKGISAIFFLFFALCDSVEMKSKILNNMVIQRKNYEHCVKELEK